MRIDWDRAPGDNRHKKNAVLTLLFLGFLLGCIWRFTRLHHRLGFATLLGWGEAVQGHPWTPVVVIGVFIVGGLLFFFHALLLWVTVFSFDPPHAALYCFAGSLASATTLYWLGRVLRRDVVARIAGSYTEEVSKALGRKGILSLFLLHVFPICPFSVLNLLAGATHISFRDFVIGTIIGMAPGLAILLIFGNQFLHLLKTPTGPHLAGLAVFVAVGLWVLTHARRRLLPKAIE
jgi:phospholipase D1/2